jgi:WD40 repeat protein
LPLAPSLTPTPTRVPGDPWLITAENLARFAPLASLGNSSLDQINLAVWAPDGARLAVGGKTGVVMLDTVTWKLLWRTEFPDAVKLQFSQDGSRLLAGGSNKSTRAVLLESATGKTLSTLFAGQIALSPDGKTVAGDGIRDALSNELIRELKFPQLTKPDFESPVETAFSPDGRQVVAGMSGGGFTAWDATSGEITYRVAGSDPYNSCQGTSTQDWMVLVCAIPSSDFSKVSLQANFINLNRPTGFGQFSFPNVANYKNQHYALLPGQSLIAWADGTKITLYDLAAGFQPVRGLPGLPGNGSLAFSPDKKNPRMAYWDNRVLQIWDPNAQKRISEFGGLAVNQMAFSPTDGRLLAYGKYDGSLTAWNVTTQERLFNYPAHPQGPVGIAFAPDGKSLASGGGDFHVRLWKLDPPNPTPLVDRQVYANVFQLAYAPDGKKLGVAYTSAYYVHLYPGSLDEQAPLRIFPTGSVAWIEIAISPRGDTLAIGNEVGTVELRSLADGALLKRFESPRRSAVRHLAFSADGGLLAAAARGLWDLKTGTLLVELSPDTVSVALSPDQCLLAAGQANGTLRLWNVQTRQFSEPSLQVFTSRIEDLAFSPDGRLLALGSWDGDVVIWGMPDGLKQPAGDVPKVKCGQ